MEIIKVDGGMADALAPLVAGFRVVLNSFRGPVTEPDIEGGKEELLFYLEKGLPVYAAVEGNEPIGYMVLRIDEPCLWVESLFVRAEHRRKGVASLLFDKAEEIAAEMGEDTVYNYIHPNNERVIGFLRSRGYTVLNLIEVRKPYSGEKPAMKIGVGKNEFDY